MSFIIGVDEVGRGPLYGSVYAAAVLRTPEIESHPDIKDSKCFHSDKKIRQVAEYIQAHSTYALGVQTAAVIDEINILQASQLAMHDAIRGVITQILQSEAAPPTSPIKIHILVDGNYFVPFVCGEDGVECTWECIVGGDRVSKTIAAASIVAKVARDMYIEDVCRINPELNIKYGLLKNKGYGSFQHRQGIQIHGPDPNHRHSFRPIRRETKVSPQLRKQTHPFEPILFYPSF